MFYGINKTKNGKEISNYDKYTPWEEGEFSGKISYELDNGEEFEIYRNFNKKNPKIFDKNANDISKEFEIDKAEGNKFMVEQTKVDEGLFTMCMVIPQQEVVLDTKSKNILIQKASNIMLTGEDNISYQKVLRKPKQKTIRRNRNTKSTNKTTIHSNSKNKRIRRKKGRTRNTNPNKRRNRKRNQRKAKRRKWRRRNTKSIASNGTNP